jgi:hypothetical protein
MGPEFTWNSKFFWNMIEPVFAFTRSAPFTQHAYIVIVIIGPEIL